MPVFLCTTHIFTVVNMKDRNLIFTDQMIKLVDHTVEITTDIITTVVSVAGIKTDTQFVAVDYASSSKDRPSSDPFPAMVSSAI